MVVLEDVGLCVLVSINGSPAKEYQFDDDVDENKHTTALNVGSKPFMCHRFIESQAGASFSVSFQALSSHTTLSVWLNGREESANEKRVIAFNTSIDGQLVGSCKVSRDRRSACMDHFVDYANHTHQQFRFAAITLIEDATKDTVTDHMKLSKDLGTFQVHAYRLIRTTVNKPRTSNNRNVPASASRGEIFARGNEIKLAEKALKGRALTHGATLGSATKITFPPDNGTEHRYRYLDSKDAPIAIFKFTYRSKEGLQQEGIIPRTPSPEYISAPKRPALHDVAPNRLADLRNRKRAADVKEESPERKLSARPLKYIRLSNGRKGVDLKM